MCFRIASYKNLIVFLNFAQYMQVSNNMNVFWMIVVVSSTTEDMRAVHSCLWQYE